MKIADRIDSLDIPRGIALFGVLAVNLLTGFRESILAHFLPDGMQMSWADSVVGYGVRCLGGGQLQLADSLQIHLLTSNPKVVAILHRQPTFGRSSDRFGKSKRHFWRNTAGALEYAT